MNLSEQIISLKTMLDIAEKEVKSLENGKKASGSKARKSLQNVKILSHSLRKNIITQTKSLPTKSRVPKLKIEIQEPVAVEEPVLEIPVEPVQLKKQKNKKCK